ncbi:MAG: DUF86 domain-containing protein [Nanoarchaeota archaeon]
MKERIEDKVSEIEKYLEELVNDVPESFEEYLNSSTIKAACERHAEKIISAIFDLAFLFARHKEFETPRDEAGIFNVLASRNIITSELAERLSDAKGMRNVLAHEYGEVDDSIVFHAISEELIKDTEEFIKNIVASLD